jgi:hypothetical protein
MAGGVKHRSGEITASVRGFGSPPISVLLAIPTTNDCRICTVVSTPQVWSIENQRHERLAPRRGHVPRALPDSKETSCRASVRSLASPMLALRRPPEHNRVATPIPPCDRQIGPQLTTARRQIQRPFSLGRR